MHWKKKRIGQLAFYDEIKMTLINKYNFRDNLSAHFTASMGAGTYTYFGK